MLSTPELFTLQNLAIVAGYSFIGGGIKYIDQVFDEHVFDRRIAFLLAIVCGFLMGYFIAVDVPSATILISIVLGVAITRKIDNIAFSIGVLLVLATPMLFRLTTTGSMPLDFFSIFFLTAAALVDEWGNDEVDRWGTNGWVKKFFYYRFVMKLMLAALVYIGTFSVVYLVAFLRFDVAYELVDWFSQRTIRKSKGLLYTRPSLFFSNGRRH